MADSDSRRAAYRWYSRSRIHWLLNTSTFTGNFIIALVITFFFRNLEHGPAVDYVFFVTVLSIGLWMTEAIPPFAVGILIIALMLVGFGSDLLVSHEEPVQMYLGTWTSNVIWLLLGGFFLAEGMRKVELDRQLFRFTVAHFGERPERLLFGLMLTTAIASMIMSNTATTAMMLSSIMPLVRRMGAGTPFSTAVLTGIPAAATLGGIGTIIGSTPNAIAVGALNEIGYHITFIDWMVVGLPTGLLLVYLFWRFLIARLDLKDVQLQLDDPEVLPIVVEPFQRYAVLFILFLTVGMWVTEPLHGIPVAATSAIPIVLLTLTQVITADQVRQLPWDTLMLVAGGLALGIALSDVGLTDLAMSRLLSFALPVMVLGFIFSLIATNLSNIMSNTAAASILVPLAIALPAPYNVVVPVAVAISCSCSLLLPVSTPSNAIAYSTGMVEQKDFRPGGLLLIGLGPMLAYFVVMLWAWLVV
jgi:solute carrier family 13 (sodium-dependent dicarboxylate transporter), member 2/3/5